MNESNRPENDAKATSPQPFDSFQASLASAAYDEFRSLPESKVESATAFDEMRNYLQDLYKDVKVVASIVDATGRLIDCIPVDQYSPVKHSNGESISSTPPVGQPAPESYEAPPPASISASTKEFSGTPFGVRNRRAIETHIQYPPGTVPMHRTTLEQLSRFRNLAAFRTKDRFGDVSPRTATSFPKKYATGEQDVNCLGGGSFVNVWKPSATPLLQGTFSQQWYVAGHEGSWMQTVECGWHVDVARYHDFEPHLFVFSTRRNYNDGQDVLNQDGRVFTPVPNAPILPGDPLPVSQIDGTQIERLMGFYLTDGAWYFYFEGQRVGYFPLSWFEGGPLTSGATRIRFGGEVGSGRPTWPPMGSGMHASASLFKAAYQRNAFFNPVGGGFLDATLSVAGSTTGPCYTIDINNNSASAWHTYLFFGGPGGQPC